MMMCLGLFVFGMSTLAYQEFERQTNYRHASTDRVGARPALQFVGVGAETISLSGVLVPELTGSALSLDALRLMAETGKAYVLVEGTGRIYGFYVIESISEGKSLFFSDGAARRIEFSINLTRKDETSLDVIGSLISATGDLIQ